MPATRIGTAGWSIPRALAEPVPGTGSHLERYAHIFSCAEINSTFYRPPRASTWQRWAASVPANFRFSVKAPRSVSHDAALAITPETTSLLDQFLSDASLLGEKLGPVLFQLPPRQAFDADRAQAFFSHLRHIYPGPTVLEPRHATWFTAEADAILLNHSISRVAADPPRVPEAATPGGDLPLRYFRLHGAPRTYYSSYTPEYLASLATQLSSVTDAWVIFDNTASGAALDNALNLRRILAVE